MSEQGPGQEQIEKVKEESSEALKAEDSIKLEDTVKETIVENDDVQKNTPVVEQKDESPSKNPDDEGSSELEKKEIEPPIDETDDMDYKDFNENDDGDADDVDGDVDMDDTSDVNDNGDNITNAIGKLKKMKRKEPIDNKQEPTFVESNLERQTHTIVLPSYSSWFDLNKVHQIEIESVSEFFQGINKNKSPEIYMKYRNFMINSYRINPNSYLSFTAVRRNLIGDAGALLRIHKFLNKWGLINYQVNPETKPKQIEPPFTGDFVVDFDTPRGMFPFESYKPPTNFPDISNVKEILAPKKGFDIETTNNNTQVEPSNKRRKIIKPDIDNGWSEDALQRLIDGVSKFKNDWYKIADYTGNNKTPDECIIRFLQLPIEDKFLEENKDLLGPLKYVPNLSFSPRDNPIMSTLAFLVNIVDSDVAVAASNRAIDVVNKNIESKLNGSHKQKAEETVSSNQKNETSIEKDTKNDTQEGFEKTIEQEKPALNNGKADNIVPSVKEEENQNTETNNIAIEEEKKENGSAGDAKTETPAVEIGNTTDNKGNEIDTNTDLTTKDSDNDNTKTQVNETNVCDDNDKEEYSRDPLVDIKDAAVNAFGILGARSHLFATFEEREMHKSLVNIIQHQLKIVDMKVSKLNSLEKEFEIQKKLLEKKSIELLEEKLSIFKYNNAATSKLLQAISIIESTSDYSQLNVNKIEELISQSKNILYKPPRKQLNIIEENEDSTSTEESNESIKPISFEAPMLYRYWSG